MNVQDLAVQVNKFIVAECGSTIPSYKLKKAIAHLFEVIKEVVASGEDVTIKDFGRFTAIDTKERVIQNDMTANLPEGKVVVPAHKAPKFRAARAYESLLRYGKQDEVNDKAA